MDADTVLVDLRCLETSGAATSSKHRKTKLYCPALVEKHVLELSIEPTLSRFARSMPV